MSNATHITLKGPWAVLGDCNLLEHETRDTQKYFRAAKVARRWSSDPDAAELTSIFCPESEEVGKYGWDIFRPSEVEGPLRIRRRSPLVIPFRKPVKSLVKTKDTKHLASSFKQGLVEWLHLYKSGRLHGNISVGTLFALDDSDEEGENGSGAQSTNGVDELSNLMREAALRRESELIDKAFELEDAKMRNYFYGKEVLPEPGRPFIRWLPGVGLVHDVPASD